MLLRWNLWSGFFFHSWHGSPLIVYSRRLKSIALLPRRTVTRRTMHPSARSQFPDLCQYPDLPSLPLICQGALRLPLRCLPCDCVWGGSKCLLSSVGSDQSGRSAQPGVSSSIASYPHVRCALSAPFDYLQSSVRQVIAADVFAPRLG